jgi:hypothetical protein
MMIREFSMLKKFGLPFFAAAILLGLSGPAFPAEGLLEFIAPTVDAPRYEIQASLEIQGPEISFNGLKLNDAEFRDFSLLKDGRPVDTAALVAPGRYTIVLRHAWISGAAYVVSIHTVAPKKAWETKTLEWRGIAPPYGGVPHPEEEGFFAPCVIEEEAGIVRRGEIISLTVTAPKAVLEGAHLSIYDKEKRLPFQPLEMKESTPLESQAKTHPVTWTYKLALAVDIKAHERKLLRIFKSAATPAPANAFTVSGENLGKTVKGERLTLNFHPQSGQILTIEDADADVKLFNKAGVIHWNPDVFTPGIAWDHSFDWNPPQSFDERSGAFLYLNARRGPMPHIKDVFLEVKYTLEKDAPYFLAETRMRVDKDLGVVALRNDEMVLYKELFDTIVYKDARGSVVKRPLKELPDKPFGLAHVTSSDPAWVGLLNAKAGYGFFSLRLESSASNLGTAGLYTHRPGTYFYAPSEADYVYWVRPWNYTWGEFDTSNLLTALPAGTILYEKNAYLVRRWNKSTPDELDALLNKLKNPIRVF